MFNTFKLGLFPFVATLLGLMTGCAMSEDPVSEGQESTSTEAGNQPNGIRPEELIPKLAYLLGQRPLQYGELLPDAAAMIEDTTEEGQRARTFLKYVVECAFSKGDEFVFPENDSGGALPAVGFGGALGLAQAWRDAPLDVKGQQWVSACLAARTNLYGKHVNILMRGSATTLVANDEEIELFSSEEGVFWGNIFLADPFLRSCYIEENMLHARLEGRECAAGHEENGTTTECGIIRIEGPCSQVCAQETAEGYHPWCWLHSDQLPTDAKTDIVITVHLQ